MTNQPNSNDGDRDRVNASELMCAYLEATNAADQELLCTLVTSDFELVLGGRTVTGIESVRALEPPEHVKTTLALQGVSIDGDSFLATIEQRVSWADSHEPADVRQVRARFFCSDRLISRVELLG
jgi:hypothetical protein